jgi:hypothetical protein
MEAPHHQLDSSVEYHYNGNVQTNTDKAAAFHNTDDRAIFLPFTLSLS